MHIDGGFNFEDLIYKQSLIPLTPVGSTVIFKNRYYGKSTNFTIDKKTEALKIISDEVKPTLGYTNTYYFHELNCNDADFDLDIDRIMNNIRTISVMVHQYFTTDITGRPING